jgi:hypothetical protein
MKDMSGIRELHLCFLDRNLILSLDALLEERSMDARGRSGCGNEVPHELAPCVG